jgi:hypothetical protein
MLRRRPGKKLGAVCFLSRVCSWFDGVFWLVSARPAPHNQMVIRVAGPCAPACCVCEHSKVIGEPVRPMQSSAVTRRLQTAKVELGMLLAASISCVAMLTIGVAATKDHAAAAPQASHLFVAALIIGGISLSFALLGYSLYATRKKLRTSLADAKTLRLNLATAESLVKAEPQTLIYWEHGHGLRVVAQTLTGVPGLPADQTECCALVFG